MTKRRAIKCRQMPHPLSSYEDKWLFISGTIGGSYLASRTALIRGAAWRLSGRRTKNYLVLRLGGTHD